MSSGVALLVTLYACINPVIAATLGVALPGEPFNLGIAAAAAFVLLGVAVVRAQTRPSGREKVSV